MKTKIAALLTDFGTADYFVAAMKGALLAVAPDATIVDITHDIPPHDIHAGAWTLANAYACFPPGTVHIAVVDPGVGSARRAIAAQAGEQFFVAPDNGLLTYIFEREQAVTVIELTNANFFRAEVSHTFHGRDVFAPVAGAILNGVSFCELGNAITDYARLPLPEVKRTPNSEPGAIVLTGAVIHVDRFGNLITNLTPDDLANTLTSTGDAASLAGAMTFEIGNRRIAGVRDTFADGADGELFAVWGSAGRLEIVARCASAAERLGVARGAQIVVRREV